MKNKEIEELLNKIRNSIKTHKKLNLDDDMLVVLEFDVIQWNLLLSYIEQLEKENKNLKDNKNEALRYILNYLALDQRYKWNDNVDEKLKLVKNILNGRKKNITNISYEDLLRQNKQLENNRDKAIEYIEKHLYKWYDLNGEEYTEPREFEKNTDASILINILKGDSDE